MKPKSVIYVTILRLKPVVCNLFKPIETEDGNLCNHIEIETEDGNLCNHIEIETEVCNLHKSMLRRSYSIINLLRRNPAAGGVDCPLSRDHHPQVQEQRDKLLQIRQMLGNICILFLNQYLSSIYLLKSP